MTPLAARLAKRIARDGPLTVADYMAAVLTDPEHGYYMRGDPFGAAGDFITAPEVSQMFGELIGLWCVDTWERLGSPAPFRLVELGPGRGTLMSDALRAARLAPAFLDAARLHLVEISPRLRALQAQRLADAPLAAEPTWHDHLGALPMGPMILIANEFFDALPIRQFVKTDSGWCERMITLAAGDAGLVFAATAPSPAVAALIPAHLRDLPPGAVAELCLPGASLAADIGQRLAEAAGAALIIDYGAAEAPGRPTLQALRGHARHDVLDAPGTADLTAHVDFTLLAATARQAGAAVHGPVPQGEFLRALGIETRARTLLQNAASAQAATVQADLRRLTRADEMGTLFKALAITTQTFASPAGFV